MKKTIFLTTLMALALAVGTAFAWDENMRDDNAYTPDPCAKDFSSPESHVGEPAGDELSNWHQNAMQEKTYVTGKAAGGVQGQCPKVVITTDKEWTAFEKMINPNAE